MDDVYAGSARAHPVEDRRRIVSRAVVDDEHLALKVAFLRKDRIDRRQYIIYGTLLKTVTMKETPFIGDISCSPNGVSLALRAYLALGFAPLCVASGKFLALAGISPV